MKILNILYVYCVCIKVIIYNYLGMYYEILNIAIASSCTSKTQKWQWLSIHRYIDIMYNCTLLNIKDKPSIYPYIDGITIKKLDHFIRGLFIFLLLFLFVQIWDQPIFPMSWLIFYFCTTSQGEYLNINKNWKVIDYPYSRFFHIK